MKKSYSFALIFGVFLLFFIQMAGTLVESIYILDLMNAALDEKALGLFFFFSPALLLLFRIKTPDRWGWGAFGPLFLARGLTPYLDTLGRMLASGIGTGAGLILFVFLMKARPKGDMRAQNRTGAAAGLALAVLFSVFLRTINYGLDYSLTPVGSWVGWGLGALLGYLLSQMEWEGVPGAQKTGGGSTAAVLGMFLVLTLIYFSFSAPAVIARWTEGNYALIVIAVSLVSAGWGVFAYSHRGIFKRISHRWMLIWNLLFTLSLTGTLLVHCVPFPQVPDAEPVVVGASSWVQHIPLVLMLLLFPVLFIDMHVFFSRVRKANPSQRELVPGMLLGGLALVLLVFMHIFTNVWGYVEPVSPWFRNKFWLPYFLTAGIISLLVARIDVTPIDTDQTEFNHRGWVSLLGILILGTTISAVFTTQVQQVVVDKSSLLVMTYNIQQANDVFGERAYERQLALIRQVSPDVVALQESDSTRISLNNNDYARYYAGKLGYYSYFGPKTVTGTYGTVLLSKYPFENTRTIFSYSDQDEIGTTVAEIVVGGRRFTIYNVHPAGSDTAKLVFAETLLADAQGKVNVIALGDYNLRDYEAAYQLIEGVYANAWTSVYPSEIGPDGVDMSGENRIDHIFFSPHLSVRDPIYVLPPESATDHPVHWAEIFWE